MPILRSSVLEMKCLPARWVNMSGEHPRRPSPLAYTAGALIGAAIGYAVPVLVAFVVVRLGNALGWFAEGSFTDLGIAAIALVFVGPLCAGVGGVLGAVVAKRRAAGAAPG
ncbi:MAG TPA: hypothetical protein VGC47_12535 [Acidimicrobiia bacterium]|jgi:hypothetical protein